MNEAWEIRRASLHDRDALEALCRASVGPDDYVISVLEDMILGGVTFVALDGDRIVGMMQYSPTIDGSAWLSAARTHPRYRRRGVARALIENFAGLAARSRVPALRLWSSSSNVEGTTSAIGNGFRAVGRFSRVRRRTAKGRSRATPLSFDGDLLSEIEGSALPRRNGGGYVPYSESFIPLTPATVHLLASAGALFRVSGGIVVLRPHPADSKVAEGVVEFGLVSGASIKVLAAIPAAAGSRGAREVRAYVPHDPEVTKAAGEAGFATEPWGREAVLFERGIDVGPTSYRKRRTYAEIAAGKREGYAALALLAGKHDHGPGGPHEDRWNP